jgi:hypothetical protein
MNKQTILQQEEDRRTKENRRKLAKAAERAGGSLEHVDTSGWETSESAAKWVRHSRRSKDRFFATVRAIQQDNKDADPDQVLRDVTEAVDAVRRKS